MLALAVKMIATAAVVIAVTLAVARLGPRLGGVVAGTPIVLGPAFFFLGREQPSAFLADAAVSTLHALAATLVFLITYVLAAARFGALASVATAVAAWIATAGLFSALPGGYTLALAVYAGIFALAFALQRLLRLPQPRARASTSWPDLLARGIAAGVLVGIATTAGAAAGPALSGTLVGFPVGFVVIGLTLHQRFGAPVARATLTAAQGGMFSLVAFAAAEAIAAPALGGRGAFWLALVSSLAVSAMLLALSHFTADRGAHPRAACAEDD